MALVEVDDQILEKTKQTCGVTDDHKLANMAFWLLERCVTAKHAGDCIAFINEETEKVTELTFPFVDLENII